MWPTILRLLAAIPLALVLRKTLRKLRARRRLRRRDQEKLQIKRIRRSIARTRKAIEDKPEVQAHLKALQAAGLKPPEGESGLLRPGDPAPDFCLQRVKQPGLPALLPATRTQRPGSRSLAG